jgi:acetate kinase
VTASVLALNAGSSSLKYTLFGGDERGETLLLGETIKVGDGDHLALLDTVLRRTRAKLGAEPSVVGHRIVHGGSFFRGPVLVDETVLMRLAELTPLAPLHLPPALDLLRGALTRLPRASHVACFDTSFHQSMPEVAKRFALPGALYDEGIHRYGFHGLSYEYIVSQLGKPPPARLVIAHLGSGASLAAIRDGRSIDTSMGLTPAGGIPMGTRSGDLDPGILIHLLRERGLSVDELEQLINHDSGLVGTAGSADMAELVGRARAGDSKALLGIELFAYAVKKQIGAYVAALGGLDCLVFTGGIGEHAPLVRELCCSGLEALGIELDAEKNAASSSVISREASRSCVRVIATDEDLMIARAARELAAQ